MKSKFYLACVVLLLGAGCKEKRKAPPQPAKVAAVDAITSATPLLTEEKVPQLLKDDLVVPEEIRAQIKAQEQAEAKASEPKNVSLNLWVANYLNKVEETQGESVASTVAQDLQLSESSQRELLVLRNSPSRRSGGTKLGEASRAFNDKLQAQHVGVEGPWLKQDEAPKRKRVAQLTEAEITDQLNELAKIAYDSARSLYDRVTIQQLGELSIMVGEQSALAAVKKRIEEERALVESKLSEAELMVAAWKLLDVEAKLAGKQTELNTTGYRPPLAGYATHLLNLKSYYLALEEYCTFVDSNWNAFWVGDAGARVLRSTELEGPYEKLAKSVIDTRKKYEGSRVLPAIAKKQPATREAQRPDQKRVLPNQR